MSGVDEAAEVSREIGTHLTEIMTISRQLFTDYRINT